MEDQELTTEQPRPRQDYWAIVTRRRWWLAAPMFVIGLAGFWVAQVWPYVYRSEALVIVEQQKIPELYVTSNVIANLQERLDRLTQQILSRTRLQGLIEQFGLYKQERAHLTMDEVVDKMRKRIRLELVQAPGRAGDLTAFRIHYSADSPQTAQRVTDELTLRLIEQNSEARTQQAEGTTNFLESSLADAKNELTKQEERLREYKTRYVGELPEQLQGNLQMLGILETQLRASTAALDRAEQQKVYLESVRTQYLDMQKSLANRERLTQQTTTSGRIPGPVAAAQATLTDLRNKLSDLKASYTSQHPEVVKMQAQVNDWETRVKRLEAEQARLQKEDPKAAMALNPANDQGLIETESRLKAVYVEADATKRDVEGLRVQIKDLQAKLSLTPVREQQLAEVMRNSENSRQYYQSLLQKKQQSELATNLEKRQQGEQFRVVDRASLPKKPEDPSRRQIILLGWMAGLGLGLALAAVREFLDHRLRTKDDLRRYSDLPVLTFIPVLRTEREQSRRKWGRALEWALAAALVVIAAGTGVHTLLKG